MTYRVAMAFVATLILAGCWSQHAEGAFSANDFPQRSVRTIAVLPVWNQTEVRNKPFDLLRGSLEHQLRTEKHYAVVPFAKVRAVLNGPGGSAFGDQLQRLDTQQAPSIDNYARLAHALEADAVLQETILAFHQTVEDGMGVDSSGGTSAMVRRVGIISVRGVLYSARDGEPIWRNQELGRYDLAASSDFGAIVDTATRDLLTNLPANTWAPIEAPAATPIPAPVTSYAPFPMPADPLQP